MLIFFALDRKAAPKKLISDRKCVNLKILKIRKNRKALKTRRD